LGSPFGLLRLPFGDPCPWCVYRICSETMLQRQNCGCHLSPAMEPGETGNMHSFLIFPPCCQYFSSKACKQQLCSRPHTTLPSPCIPLPSPRIPQRLHAPPSASSHYAASTSKGLARPELEHYPPTACLGRQRAQALVSKTVRNTGVQI